MKQLNMLLLESGIKNFSAPELTKGMSVPEEYHANIVPTLILLQSIRDYLGRPIRINSAYRTPEFNKSLGGKADSMHLLFNAIDFKPKGFTSEDLVKLTEDIEDNKFATMTLWFGKLITLTPEMLGIGLYDNFIHLDTRGLLNKKSPARWIK